MDRVNNGTVHDRFDPYRFHNLRKNLNTITELYPKMCRDFINRLKKMKEEVSKININFDDDFLGRMSSIDWVPGRLFYKDGISPTSKEYRKAFEEASNKKIKLNTKEFNKRLRKEVLWSIDKLIYMLEFYLNIHLNKSSIILDYQNKTLYDKVERMDEEEMIKVLKRIKEI